MAGKEQENFCRNTILIVDHAKDSLVDVLELHLANNNILSFEDFINDHQHDIYHLCFNKRQCCQCPQGYVLLISRVLHPPQLEILLDKNGVPRSCHVHGKQAHSCHYLAKPGVTTNVLDLDITLARCLLINFCDDMFKKSCSLRKNIDTLLQMRNVYGHAKEVRITDDDYRIDKNEIESAILEIAKVCGNETGKKQILMDLEKRSLDGKLCIHYQNTLLGQIARETQIEEKLDDLAGKIPEIIEKAVAKALDDNAKQMLTKDPPSNPTTNIKDPTPTSLILVVRIPNTLPPVTMISVNYANLPNPIERPISQGQTQVEVYVAGLSARTQYNFLVTAHNEVGSSPEFSLPYTTLAPLLRYFKKLKLTWSLEVPQSSVTGTSDEIKMDKELLSKGTFISYDNCVYLGGACNVGKSTLASILIGEEISQHWKSTDGLTIYFGRNGIDLKTKEMVPLKQDFNGDVVSKVIRGKPEMTQEKPDTTHREEVLPHDSNEGDIIPEIHTVAQHTDITLPPSIVPGTGKDDVNITEPVRQNYIITTIQEQIRKGTYKIEIAPSDLIDFGGQRSFDMTHQLFMRRKGTFVLMFNGRIDFSIPLKEYEQGETTESILKHWVNSFLSFCADDEDILPIIIFCATHSDDFYQEDRKDRKKKLIHDLGEIFKNHKQQHRIIYDDIFFINGQDKNDPEIHKLKSKLVEVACKQKSWSKRIPMACVPLDIQMSELRLHNMSIISKEELLTLNERYDLAVTDEQIKYFLNYQHSLGKIVYFDQHGLDNFINLQPQSLVNILRSFITAECFWPEDKELKGILCALMDTGKIAKQDLLKLWSQEKFHQDMPNDDFKEFIIQVLVHLDILVELKHYRQEQEIKVQSYLVPCIVKRRLPVTDFYVKSADKMICLSYTLLKSSIPVALSFKLIGAAINVWPLKETPEGNFLYHQAAILCIDGSNDLHLMVEDDKVFVYLINKVAKHHISPNIASAVQECLTLTMTKVLEYYHKSFGKSLSTFEVSKAFEIKVGEWCTSGGGCYISVPEVKEKREWLCKNNKTHLHVTKYPLYWISDKNQVECDPGCSGLDEKCLALHPGDKHFFRLAKLITLDECYSVVMGLGLSKITWDDIQNMDRYDITDRKGVALCKWRDQKEKDMSKTSFQELSDALAKEKKTHVLCQLFMEDVTVYGIANSALQEIPEDDVLQDLSKEVGNCAVHLGVELGLSMAAIEGILFEYPKSMFKQTVGVMKEWKSSSKVKPTILMLMKAFQSAAGGGLRFLRKKYGVNGM